MNNLFETVVGAAPEATDTTATTQSTTATEAGTTEKQPEPQPEPQQMSGFMSFLPFILLILVFYFVLIRPQKKQEKKQKAMLAALQVGDKVVTIGGICGKISKLKDEYVYIETGFVGNPNEKATIKMERAAIKVVETVHEETEA